LSIIDEKKINIMKAILVLHLHNKMSKRLNTS